MSVSYWKASEILKTCQSIVKGSSFPSVPPTQGKFAMQKNIHCSKKEKKKKKETCQDLLLTFLWHKYNVKGVLLLTQSLFFRLTLNLQQYHDISLFCHE